MIGGPLYAISSTANEEPWEDPAVVANDFQARARREGTEFDAIALAYLQSAGATVTQGKHHRHRYPVDAELLAGDGRRFIVLAHGNLGTSSAQPGLRRADTVAKVAHRAVGLSWHHEPPVLIVTSHLPLPHSSCAYQLADLHHHLGAAVADVVATVGDLPGYHRLRRRFGPGPDPEWAPWWNPGQDPTLFDHLVPNRPHA